MKRFLWIAACLTLLCATIASAGVYNTAEPLQLPSETYQDFRKTHIALRQIANEEVEVPTPMRARYLMVAKAKNAALNPGERLNVGAYLLGLGKTDEAIGILKQGTLADRQNFLLPSTLATAEFLSAQRMAAVDPRAGAQQMQLAAQHLSDALSQWPKSWDQVPANQRQFLQQCDWSDEVYQNFLHAERMLLRLMRVRATELAKSKAKAPAFRPEPDALFDDGGKPAQPLRFVNDEGKFEPGQGKLAQQEVAKLPPDALKTLQQLVLWMPHDDRLVWLLAELFCAEGDVNGAAELFRDIAKRQQFPPVPNAPVELVPVKKDLKKGTAQPPTGWDKQPEMPALFREHWIAIEDYLAEEKRQSDKKALEESQPPPPIFNPDAEKIKTPGRLDVSTLLIGALLGAVVALFAYWQVRESRRRWQARSPSRSGGPQG